MIFHRLRVANYRGIVDAEVRFSPTGVTVVQGPNEIGKSSLMQAVGTLFDVRATARSNNREVRKFKPLDRDAAPEIELEAESGDFHFVYRKRYLKEPLTELKITRPRPETKTGDDAHQAVQDILKTTLDRVLWDALRIQQGNAVGLPWVKADDGNNPLIAALDMAVSGLSRDDPGSDSLHQKARQEYEKYFTPEKGAPGRVLAESEAGVREAEQAVEDYGGRLRDLESQLESASAIRARLAELNARGAELAGELSSCREVVAELERLERRRDAERAAAERALEALAAAERDRDARSGLARAEAAAAEALERAARDFDEAAAPVETASRLVDETRADATAADTHRREAEALASLRLADHEYHRNRADLEQLRERKQRIDHSRALAASARDEIAANAVTEKAASEIAKAEADVARAAARLEGSATALRLEASADAAVLLDGGEERLSAGETRELSVADHLRLEIPGFLAVEVTAGGGAGELAHRLREAEERLRSLLAGHGVREAGEVAALLEKRREAERVVSDLGRVERENLRDLSYDDLVEQLRDLERAVAAHAEARADGPPMAATLDAARMAREEADAAKTAAGDRWRQTEAARTEAARRLDAAREDHIVRRERLEAARRELDRARDALSRARAASPDEALAEAAEKAAGERSTALATLAGIEEQLREREPEAIRERLDVFGKSLENARSQRARLELELAELRVKLEFHGGEGVYEKLADAEAELERRRRADASLRRRADAARLLWLTLDRARNESRQAYAEPLRLEIERLGRDVFGSGFGVAIDDDLQIASRTLDGFPVPYAELSGGAQEQLSLIHRAACSILASRHKGMPLILDDALGYSDAGRLRGMGLALSRAARQCQIIILTCMPDRYSYVGAAQIVDLARPRE